MMRSLGIWHRVGSDKPDTQNDCLADGRHGSKLHDCTVIVGFLSRLLLEYEPNDKLV